MRHSFIPVALAASFWWLGGGYNESYCAFSGGHHGYETCSFPNLEACRAYVSGVGGLCRPNLAAIVQEPPPMRQQKARKRQY